MVKKNRGFTLLELLVVLAVFAIITAFLLVGLNPLEQVKKSQDATKLGRAREALSSAEAYYAFFQSDPANCQSLIDTDHLKSGSCDEVVLSGVAGTYQVTFAAFSRAFQDTCGGAICTVPDDFI